MIARGFALVAALALGACDMADEMADRAARAAAKDVVDDTVSRRFPGVNAAPVTDCVIDNASASEIVAIARDGALGREAEAAALVVEILERPATLRCVARNGAQLVPALAGL